MGDKEEWDEWEDDGAAEQPGDDAAAEKHSPSVPPSTPHAVVAGPVLEEKEPYRVVSSPRKPLEWKWNLDELDQDLATLPPSATWSIEMNPFPAAIAAPQLEDCEAHLLCRLASLALPTQRGLEDQARQTNTMKALASVTKWNLLRLQQSLHGSNTVENDENQLVAALDEQLQGLAGDWAASVSSDQAGDGSTTHQHLREMSSMLQNALLACEDEEDGDITPFQQAFEQLFASLPNQSLSVPITWIRPHHGTDNTTTGLPFDAYLNRLVALCGGDSVLAAVSNQVVPVLTDAEVFQDTKDIQRDELLVDGEAVAGSVGYEAIVAMVEKHIRKALCTVAPTTTSDQQPHTDNAVIRDVAKQILHACNRTESGGGSYEILSQFVSNHSMETILIRPDSARAPPLQIAMDLGPFQTSGEPHTWCFGLRVHVSALTWYYICDASDPTQEYYHVQTTYANRLAFPLGLGPLSKASMMRHDAGDVTIKVVHTENDLATPSSSSPSPRHHRGAEAEAEKEKGDDVDYDALL